MSPSTAELLRLNADPEFLELFRTDPVLNELESRRIDESAEFLNLAGALGCSFRIGEVPVHPLTAARWSLLWALENAYPRGGAVTSTDIEIFLYILAHDVRKLPCKLHEIPAAAAGYLTAAKISPIDAHDAIQGIIDAAFLPLRMVPDGEEPTETRYDALWLARIAGIAARESGHTASYCKFEMSLGEVCDHYIVMLQRETPEDYSRLIRRHPDRETEEKILKRTLELQKQFLANHKPTGGKSCPKS